MRSFQRAALAVALSIGLSGAVSATAGPNAYEPTADAPNASGPPSAQRPDVEFFPTPQEAVDRMLEMAGVTTGDFVIDLGSGDGRIPITAARRFGARGLGIELDADLVARSRAGAAKAGVTDKVEFRRQDLFETDISAATVVTMFLLGSINMKLRPRLLSELKPGVRVVSYSFGMGDWPPDRVERVNGRPIYLWTIPARPPAPEAHR